MPKIHDPNLVSESNPRGAKPDPRTTRGPDDGPTPEEQAVGKALTEAEDFWNKIAASSEINQGALMPCNECGGAGRMDNGSFGSTPCFECEGKRMVEDPFADPIEVPMPDFAALRANKTLTLEAAKEVKKQGKTFIDEIRKQNKLGAGRVEKLLPAPLQERESFGSLDSGFDPDETNPGDD